VQSFLILQWFIDSNGIFSLCFRYTSDPEHELLDKCSFLDPRVKSLPYLSIAEKSKIQDVVFCEMIKLETKFSNINRAASPSPACSSDTVLSQLLGPAYHNRMTSLNELVSLELANYVKAEQCSFNDSPLLWWKTRSQHYPRLALLARQYLSIQGTSVASERVFSTAGEIISQRRSRISSDMVDKILFLNKNLK